MRVVSTSALLLAAACSRLPDAAAALRGPDGACADIEADLAFHDASPTERPAFLAALRTTRWWRARARRHPNFPGALAGPDGGLRVAPVDLGRRAGGYVVSAAWAIPWTRRNQRGLAEDHLYVDGRRRASGLALGDVVVLARSPSLRLLAVRIGADGVPVLVGREWRHEATQGHDGAGWAAWFVGDRLHVRTDLCTHDDPE